MSSLDYSFTIDGPPRPKARPRLTRRGRAYTPKETLEYEKHVAESYEGPLYDGPVCMEIDLAVDHTRVHIYPAEWSSPLRGDIDNYVKAVMDGLQGKAFTNDRQVVLMTAEKL